MSKIYIAILLLMSELAGAQYNSTVPVPTPSGGVGTTQVSKTVTVGGKAEENNQALKISGECEVIATEGAFTGGGPCNSLSLTLTGQDPSEVLYTRTTTEGTFEFSVQKAGKYKMGVSSRFYTVAAPTGAIPAGSTIRVKLQQK